MQRAQVVRRQPVEAHALVLRQLHGRARDVVRLAERHALAHEVLGQVGGQHLGDQFLRQLPRHRPQRGQHAARDLEAVLDGLHSVEEGLLVLLEVLVVGARQPLERGHEPREVPQHPAGLAAQQLEGVRVLLLRHQRGARAVGVAEHHAALVVQDDEVLGQLGQVRQREGRPPHVLGDVVPVADGVHGVEGDRGEAQLLAQELAVQPERVARDGPTAQGQRVDPGHQVLQPIGVALEGGHVGHDPVAEAHGLRRLEVGEPGHEQVQVVLGELASHAQALRQEPPRRRRRLASPQA
mmetsp:Transcript_1604/g.2628  ORF Transcript_1604/g.2628 Transcript_1604/m.2628 type:complete len:295 (-) Transcript_1604:445-1329(-)